MAGRVQGRISFRTKVPSRRAKTIFPPFSVGKPRDDVRRPEGQYPARSRPSNLRGQKIDGQSFPGMPAASSAFRIRIVAGIWPADRWQMAAISRAIACDRVQAGFRASRLDRNRSTGNPQPLSNSGGMPQGIWFGSSMPKASGGARQVGANSFGFRSRTGRSKHESSAWAALGPARRPPGRTHRAHRHHRTRIVPRPKRG